MSPADIELLALLAEECGEVVQIVGKCLRHGLKAHHPDDLGGEENNAALLEKELGDVLAAIELLRRNCIVSDASIHQARDGKLQRIGKYLHHAKVRP